jgi:protein-S-isoprenylcysteine O-methyltransferase Ste14
MEERYMEEKFGDEYRAYRECVPALIPNPFRKKQEA